jgi:hypothetical protein
MIVSSTPSYYASILRHQVRTYTINKFLYVRQFQRELDASRILLVPYRAWH